jgi:hypothetical protein
MVLAEPLLIAKSPEDWLSPTLTKPEPELILKLKFLRLLKV